MEFGGRHKRGSANHRPQKYGILRHVRVRRILGPSMSSIHQKNRINETISDMQRSTAWDIATKSLDPKTEGQLQAVLHRPHLAHSAFRNAMQLEEATAATSTATSTTTYQKIQTPLKLGDNNRHVPLRHIGTPNMVKWSPDPRLQ